MRLPKVITVFKLQYYLLWLKIEQNFPGFGVKYSLRRLSLRRVFSALFPGVGYLVETISSFQETFNAS